MTDLPRGTVTLVFTDIEGSTRLLHALGGRYQEVLVDVRRLLRSAFARHDGREVDSRGEESFFVFARARAAVAAASAAQGAIDGHPWPDGIAVRVRMALHTGEPEIGGTGYVGLDVHHAARLLAVGHGGQILLSESTHAVLGGDLPPETRLLDLGRHALRDLPNPEYIFQVLHPSLPADFPPLRTIDIRRHNLPAQMTSFIGRATERRGLRALLSRSRLVTLTGPGGTGKTRLAVEVGREVLDAYPDGVWLVDLSGLVDPLLVAAAAASALHVPETGAHSTADVLLDYLRPRRLLLILDNCEHLIAACASLVFALLRSCPGLSILATSREPLGVGGEVLYGVAPLPRPDPGQISGTESLERFDAVRLLLDRAALSRPGFSLNEENGPALARICHRLDGLPLAIELAAPLLKVLSPDEMATRLEDRLDLLRGPDRGRDPHHRTLRAAMDWSHDLLTESERTLFARLAVFVGGFTLEAAEQVCAGGGLEVGEVLEWLIRLTDKSLVGVEERGPATRYRLLETIRAYASDRLRERGEEATLQHRHVRWYVDLAEDAEGALQGPEQARWLARLDDELGNLRAALERALDLGEAEAVLRLAGSLRRYWMVRGLWAEGRQWLDRALATEAEVTRLARARALAAAASLAQGQGDYRRAIELGGESLAASKDAEDPALVARTLITLGNAHYEQGQYAEAERHYQDGLALARRSGDDHGTAAALVNLAALADHQGDYARAAELCHESLAMFRRVGDRRSIAFALNLLGVIASDQDDPPRAQRHYEESLAVRRELGDRRGIAGSLTNLGRIASNQGDDDEARRLHAESLAIRRELGDRYGIAASLVQLAAISERQDDRPGARRLYEEALEARMGLGDRPGVADCLEGLARLVDAMRAPMLLAAGESLRRAAGASLTSTQQKIRADLTDRLRAVLGEEVFAAAWRRGEALSMEEIADLARQEASPHGSAGAHNS